MLTLRSVHFYMVELVADTAEALKLTLERHGRMLEDSPAPGRGGCNWRIGKCTAEVLVMDGVAAAQLAVQEGWPVTHVYTFAVQPGWHLMAPLMQVIWQFGSVKLLTVTRLMKTTGLFEGRARKLGPVKTTGRSGFTLSILTQAMVLNGLRVGARVLARAADDLEVLCDPEARRWYRAKITALCAEAGTACVQYHDGIIAQHVPLWWIRPA